MVEEVETGYVWGGWARHVEDENEGVKKES